MRRAARPVLSIGLLVSNRKDTVRKCLDSLTPIREAVACELIITDTGCDADLRAVLEEYADKLNEFVWCNDFSKARNANLALAEGEWYLYVDDDEWFTETADLIGFFTSGEYKKFADASYIQRNYNDREGTGYTDSWVSRVAKITPEIHFVSKIHEYLEPTNGSRRAIQAVVDHYGYVFDSEEECRKHYERNVPLLLDMITAEPKNLRWRMQLSMEYRFVEEYENLYRFCEESLAVSRKMTGMNEAVAIGSFYAGEALACIHLEKYGDVLRVCEEAERDKRILEYARAFLSMEKADACARLQKNEEAEEAICAYFRWKHELDINEGKQFIQGSAPFVGRAMDEVNIRRSYILRIDIAYRLLICGSDEDYAKLRERLAHFVQVTRDYQAAFPGQDRDVEGLYQYVQAADLISRALELETDDPAAAMKLYREVVEIDNMYANVISAYMRLYGERTSSEHRQAEFEELKEKVLVEVAGYIRKDRYAEALAILSELKKVNPTDLEIAQMALQTRLLLLRQK
jgi:glycosyltransferase involved in cell wall biosynthesis/predicted nucleic acid-binding protein